jgi:transcriptional regulator with XRE-family HTH domain
MADDRRPASTRSVFPGFSADGIAADAVELVRLLARRRQDQGLSQTEVAARMGTSQSAVARLEAAAGDLRLSTLQRYAAALDAHVGFAVRDQSDGAPR